MRHSCWLRALLVSGVCVLPIASPAMAKGVFVLQLGSFKTASEAEAHAGKLQSGNSALSNLSVQVSEVSLQPDNFKVYRTQAGPVASRPEAQRLCTQVKSTGSECFVVESAMFAANPATPTVKSSAAMQAMPAEEETKPVTLADESPRPAALPPELPPAKQEPVREARLQDAGPVAAPAAQMKPSEPAPAAEKSTVADKPDSMFSWIFSDDDKTSTMEAPKAPAETATEAASPAAMAASAPAAGTDPGDQDRNRTPDPSMRKRQRFARAKPAMAEMPLSSAANETAIASMEPLPAASAPEPMRIESPQPVIRRNEPVESASMANESVAPLPPLEKPRSEPMMAEPAYIPPPAPRVIEPARPAPAMPMAEPADTPPPRMAEPAYTPPPRASSPVLEKTADGYVKGREPKALNVGAAPEIAAMPEPMEPAREGSVQVAEAVRVPVTQTRAPVTRVMTAETEAVRYAYPSQDLGIRTLWAQLSTFSDEQTALNYWNNFSASNGDIASNVRVRVTRPYMGYGRAGGVSLRVGPYGSAEEIRALCERAANDNLRCSGGTDLGSGGARGQERARGLTPRDYTAAPRTLYGSGESYWVQLGSYASRGEAQAMWERLQSSHRGLLAKRSGSIVTPSSGSHSRPVYRLRTGPFASSGDAANLCGRLSSKGANCLVVTDR